MKFKKIVSFFSAIVLFNLFCGAAVFANTPQNSYAVQNSTKRYIIKFKTSNINGNKLISKYSGKLKHQYKHFNVATADLTAQSLSNLKKDSNVAYVQQDYIVKASKVKVSASSVTDWGVSDINAPSSWQSGLTGKGVKIAVIDTGAGPHPDLSIAGGTNVISGSNTASYTDDNGHGTHVAGIINGQGLGNGVKGIAPDASIYAVKALDSTGSGYISDIISGIDWAISSKMDIISLSLGAGQSDTVLQDAVDTAYNNGILVVAAAGNDGNSSGTGTNIEYPANYSSVIAVAAVDSTNTRAYFSSTGSKLEVSAPGVNITSTYLNGKYASMSGTSMAAPFVAGDLALLKQKYPSYTNVQLRQLLDSGVKDLGVKGRDSLYGYGLVEAPSTPVPQPAPVAAPEAPKANVPSGTYTTSQNVTLTDATTGVSIYYTLDGTTPTTKSNLYTSPIAIVSTKTLKAVAVNSSGVCSPVFSAIYTISKPAAIPAPEVSLPSGSYKGPVIVRLYDNHSKPLRIYYTMDGTTPNAKSIPYAGYIMINSTCTLKAVAVDKSGNTSGISSSSYTIIVPPSAPSISLRSGIYFKPQSVTLSDSTKGASIYYTTNGTIPTAKSTLYTGPVTISKNTILTAVAIDKSGNKSKAVYSIYIIHTFTYK